MCIVPDSPKKLYGRILGEESSHVSCDGFISVCVFDLLLNVDSFPAKRSTAAELHVAQVDNVQEHLPAFFPNVKESKVLDEFDRNLETFFGNYLLKAETLLLHISLDPFYI